MAVVASNHCRRKRPLPNSAKLFARSCVLDIEYGSEYHEQMGVEYLRISVSAASDSVSHGVQFCRLAAFYVAENLQIQTPRFA